MGCFLFVLPETWFTLYSGHMVYTFYIHILNYLVQFDSKGVLFWGEFHAVFIKITQVVVHEVD